MVALALAIIGALSLAQIEVVRNLSIGVKILFVGLGGGMTLLLGSHLCWKKQSSSSLSLSKPSVVIPAKDPGRALPSRPIPFAGPPAPAPALAALPAKMPIKDPGRVLPPGQMAFAGPPAPAPDPIVIPQGILSPNVMTLLGLPAPIPAPVNVPNLIANPKVPQILPTPAPVIVHEPSNLLTTLRGKVVDISKAVLLGKGGFGTVIRGEIQEKDGRVIYVAIKIMSSISDYDSFKKETDIICYLNKHRVRHIVQLYDTIENSDHPLFVQQKLIPKNHSQVLIDAGTTLKQLCTEKQFSFTRCYSVALQLLRCLSDAHRLKIAHLDLTINNILMDKRDNLTVIDWGLAALVPVSVKTMEGNAPRYFLPPEYFLESETFDSPADIWTVGCTLYQISTGEMLFPGGDSFSMLALMVRELDFPSTTITQAQEKIINHLITNGITASTKLQKMAHAQKCLQMKGATREQTTAFLGLIMKMLTWDPAKRITAEAAFQELLKIVVD